MTVPETPLFWLGGTEIRTPPVGLEARRALGRALAVLQQGGRLTMPLSRPMPSIGPRCQELRVRDGSTDKAWRLVVRMDPDAVLVVDLFEKRSRATPRTAFRRCKERLRRYDLERRGEG